MSNSATRMTGILPVVAFFVVAFILHWLWEMAQMPLFELAPMSFWETVRMCLFATATGDMLFMLTIYLVLATVHMDWSWASKRAAYRHPATWVVAVVIGALLAVSFELWAVHTVERWQYGAMPVVPIIYVGVTPLLQMIVLPLLTIIVCWQIAIWNR